MSLLYLFPFGSWNKFTFPRSLYSLKCSYQLFWLPLLALLEKAMATHSSTLAWKIPWMEEPGRLQSMGSLSRTEQLHFHFSLSCTGEGNCNPLHNPLQCSCLENPRDGGAWWAAVYGVAQSQTRLKRLSSSSSWLFIRPNGTERNLKNRHRICWIY